MSHVAPIARLTLAYAAGIAVGLAGAPLWVAPLPVLVGMALPICASLRPAPRLPLLVAASAGVLAGAGADSRICPPVGTALHGHFLASPRTGSAPFLRGDGCGAVTVVVPGEIGDEPDSTVSAGIPLVIHGTWREGAIRPWFQASRIEADSARGRPGRARPSGVPAMHRAVVRWRDGLVGRLPELYGEHAPLVAALVFARREGLDREVREAFAVTGIAHLLAISGFHVGVIAGLALAALRAAGASRRRAAAAAAVLAWIYVGLIGFPDAACRAALILGLVCASRLRGRPPSRWGALAVAALVLLTTGPSRLASPGFQLSFAGAAGLTAWGRPLEVWLRSRSRGRLPRSVASGCAAGVAATLATLPIVAWHFERVSLVGIPMTLVASPLVSLALPGALATLALEPRMPSAARFLAGGVDGVFALLVAGTSYVAEWPFASVWSTRPTVLATLAGVGAASYVARRPWIGAVARRRLTIAYAAVGAVGWPLLVGLQRRPALEMLVVDVGQGDAIAVRTPRNRWVLVDAGPPVDRGRLPVVRALRARGVHRLEALVLTHPDADHYGGAEGVLRSFRVGRVFDPLVPAPKPEYSALLRGARQEGIPWTAARAGDSWEIDGVDFEVLHPSAETPLDPEEANEASVVLRVRWGDFVALLTGDAYMTTERALMEQVGDIDVLKVGHHGSNTSTDPDFLRAVRPEVAVLSVGRRNRYGHPAPEVLARLEGVGAEIVRTDRVGDIRILVRRDGSIEVRPGAILVP